MFLFTYKHRASEFPSELLTFEQGLAFLSRYKSNLSISNARLFIYIANNVVRILSKEGVTLKQIAKEISMPYGTLGRQIDLLEGGYGNFAGLGWIERGLDEDSPKARRIRLTELGERIMVELAETLRTGHLRPHPVAAQHDRERREFNRLTGVFEEEDDSE